MYITAYIQLCLMFEYASALFPSRAHHTKTPCEVNGSALVEQFFNNIFAEFNHSPPICLCVQMCLHQATYCYPNGCFKKADSKKEASAVSKIQHEGAEIMFLVNDKDFTAGKGNVKSVPSQLTDSLWQSSSKFIGRPNPLNEMVFKYKKIPRLEMKYNLREQVKNTKEKKSELDVSKSRWPTNKQLNRQSYKIYHNGNLNYFDSVDHHETNQPEIPKYLKRYLTKRENQNGSDIGALYLNKDASNFSLETLIDNLIERGLEGVNSTLEINVNKLSKIKNIGQENDTKTINRAVEDIPNNLHNSNYDEDLTFSSRKTDNQYKNMFDYVNGTTSAYFEMITTLSRKIENKINSSRESLENFTGKTLEDVTDDNNLNTIDLQSFNSNPRNLVKSHYETTSQTSEEKTKSTTDNTFTVSHNQTPIINRHVTKSRQRIVRKLRNKTFNK